MPRENGEFPPHHHHQSVSRRQSSISQSTTNDRTTDDDDEYGAAELQVYIDVADLVSGLVAALGFRYVDARRQVLLWGAVRCEGALMFTVAMMADGLVRRPTGWFVTTLRKGLEWTPEEVGMDLQARRERNLREREQSNDVTMRRLAQEERAKSDALAARAFTESAADASETTRSAGRSSNGSSAG